jgi:hypothetical protein
MKTRAGTALGSRRTPGHDDYVAQSTFGTWRFMLPDSDPGRQRLWQDAVRFAFPNLSRPESDLTDDIVAIYALRNRVAHMEPLLGTMIVRDCLKAMVQVLGEIDPKAEAWFTSGQRVSSLLSARPTQK